MKAAHTTTYGPADVLDIREVPAPTPGPTEVLVAVHASPVTAGDLRLRSADFPSFTAVIGRLMFGLLRPRRPVQGSMFAGRIVEVGSEVTRWSVGEDVFGESGDGAYGELITLAEDAPMGRIPEGVSYEEAAAVPYGAGTALVFLRDKTQVEPGERVLVLGASGGVGRFAVQLARHLGAEVTAVCGRSRFDLVRELGASQVVDYREEDWASRGQEYDVIFDIAGVSSFSRARRHLSAQGRYLTLTMSLAAMVQTAITPLLGGPRAIFGLTFPDQERTREIAELLAQGAIAPVISHRYPFERISEAHAQAEARSQAGAVVITLAPSEPQRLTLAS